jgi:hypothetical protein
MAEQKDLLTSHQTASIGLHALSAEIVHRCILPSPGLESQRQELGHPDPGQTRPHRQTLPQLRMSHVRLSLTVMSLSQLNFQSMTARLNLAFLILFVNAAFSFSLHHMSWSHTQPGDTVRIN